MHISTKNYNSLLLLALCNSLQNSILGVVFFLHHETNVILLLLHLMIRCRVFKYSWKSKARKCEAENACSATNNPAFSVSHRNPLVANYEHQRSFYFYRALSLTSNVATYNGKMADFVVEGTHTFWHSSNITTIKNGKNNLALPLTCCYKWCFLVTLR